MKHLIRLILVLSCLWAYDTTLEVSSQGMTYFEKQYAVLMDNLVNAKTPGFREVTITPYYNEGQKTMIYRRGNIFAVGPYVNTGRNLDFALDNPDLFFMVADDEGRLLLTRDGRFEFDNNQYLVTMSGGFRVLNMERNRIQIPPFESVRIDPEGMIYNQDSEYVDQLGIVRVPNPHRLRSINNVFFMIDVDDESLLQAPEQINVKQGYYEGSNIEYAKLLAKIADANKYNANTQVVQSRIKMLDTVIDLVRQN